MGLFTRPTPRIEAELAPVKEELQKARNLLPTAAASRIRLKEHAREHAEVKFPAPHIRVRFLLRMRQRVRSEQHPLRGALAHVSQYRNRW